MKLGDYEVLSEIGRGGMGVVYHARTASGREVAIKVLPRASSDAALVRFEREKELQGALGEEDGFVPLLDSGERQREPWLVMPFVGGGSLRDRLRRGPLSLEETVSLARTLARAIAKAHSRGIVHRDLKPENILYTTSRRPLVADLGVAKRFDALAGEGSPHSLSKSGAFVGTVGYLSPEQLASSRSAGPPADVFALGAILYECLAGKPAFAGESTLELCAKVASGLVEPLSRVRPDAPAGLVRIIERALAPAPGDRFRSGEELARALSGLEEEAASAAGRRIPFWVLVVLLLLVLGGGAAAVALIMVSREAEELREVEAREEQERLRKMDEERRRREAVLRVVEEKKRAEEKARKDARDAAAAAFEAARLARARNDQDGVVAACSKSIELDATFVPAWAARADAHFRKGELDQAISDATHALELDPKCSPAFEARANGRLFKQDYAGAIDDLTRSLDAGGRTGSAYVSRGNAYGAVGDLQAAIADYTRAIEVDPRNAVAYANRGNARAMLNEDEAALADYGLSLEMDPRSSNTYKGRGILRERKGDAKGAIEDFEKYLELVPRAGDAQAIQAEIDKLRKP